MQQLLNQPTLYSQAISSISLPLRNQMFNGRTIRVLTSKLVNQISNFKLVAIGAVALLILATIYKRYKNSSTSISSKTDT